MLIIVFMQDITKNQVNRRNGTAVREVGDRPVLAIKFGQ